VKDRNVGVVASWLFGAVLLSSGTSFARLPGAPGLAAPEVPVSADASASGTATAGDTQAVAATPTPPPLPPPAVAPPPPPIDAWPPKLDAPKIETPTVTLKLGLLLQPQYEMLGSADRSKVSHNIYLRRTRLLVGGTLFKDFEFFFETDSPNLFKADATTGTKNIPGLIVQDAYGTWKAVGDALKLDLGYMLPPTSHNGLQGAGTLYGWDYFSNTFRHDGAAVFNNSGAAAGRDAGIQLRGLVAGGMIEYRAGLFQGYRNPNNNTMVGSRRGLRGVGRIQVNLLDPETGFFYAGTYLGTKKVLSFGASLDMQLGTPDSIQNGYQHYDFDGLLDMPMGPGVLTAQVDFNSWRGRDYAALPRQTALSGEVGYLIKAIKLSPILRAENRWVVRESVGQPDEARFGLGLAFWPYGHNINLKASYLRIVPNVRAPAAVHAYDAFNLQAQLYIF